MLARLFCIVVSLFLASSAAIAQSDAAREQFEKKVRPLFVEHCLNCHGAEGKKIKGGFSLRGRATMLAGGDSGVVVVPGKPKESTLLKMLEYHGELKMPPKGKLPDADIKQIEQWIAAGAVWPGDEHGATTQNKPTVGFTEEQKNFWAFQPLRNGQKPIDEHLAAAWRDAQITPAVEAAPHVLLRRLHYDLVGLPPSVADLRNFQASYAKDADHAIAAEVDRLLALPAYGERWGRHWLDVARYADSNGLDENIYYQHAYRYRDYVIESFNKDKPYNIFLQEQIAGDLLPKSEYEATTRERHTALGYLALGPKLLAEPDKQKMLIDIADEQLDMVTKSVLGLTVACARCHDHKFDPIPTRDYYSLLAVFTSTRTMQNLNTVAKVYERRLSPQEHPEAAMIRGRLDRARTNLRLAKRAFNQTPPSDKTALAEHQKKIDKAATILRWMEKLAPDFDMIVGVEEGSADAYGTTPRNLYVQARGNYTTPLEEAPAGYLRILPAGPVVETKPNPDDQRKENKTRFGSLRASSGRLELAQWLTDTKNPLTARVFVNRVWKHHFGEGLVRTVDNFGRLGETPSHPALLDDLAQEFMRDGWSIKQLHRRILTSRAYRLAAEPTKSALTKDPENRLLSHYPRRRLEAEPIRDAILSVSGTLDDTIGGTLHTVTNQDYSGFPKYDQLRRTVYLPVLRSKLFDFMQTFDFPDPSTPNGKRESTVVAPQGLWFLNSDFVRTRAKDFAERLHREEPSNAEARVRLAYLLAYSREAQAEEVKRALEYINTNGDQGWARFAQALFAANEFIHLN